MCFDFCLFLVSVRRWWFVALFVCIVGLWLRFWFLVLGGCLLVAVGCL